MNGGLPNWFAYWVSLVRACTTGSVMGCYRHASSMNPCTALVVWADEAEQQRLRQYHERAIGDDFRHRWTEAPLVEQND